MNVSKIESELKKYLSKKVKFAFLFGSALTKYFRPESDLDLAIYLGRKIQTQEFLHFKENLEEHFRNNYNFDLVLLDTADPIIAMQVLEAGKLLIKDDIDEFINFKARMISQYIDFKMDRKIIEDSLAEAQFMINKDAILAKISIIKNCLKRIKDTTKLDPDRFLTLTIKTFLYSTSKEQFKQPLIFHIRSFPPMAIRCQILIK